MISQEHPTRIPSRVKIVSCCKLCVLTFNAQYEAIVEPSWEQGGFFVGVRQETGNYQEGNFSSDVSHIGFLRDVFAAEGIRETDPTKILSYNPILDRFNYEKRLLQGMTNEERDIFARNIAFQMETNLRERYHVVSSAFDLLIKNNLLHSSIDQHEQLQDIYWRGVEYRKSIGSKEEYREIAELLGFIEVTQKELVADEAVEGTTIVVVSPPGIVPQTAYPKNFIDVLKLRYDKVTKQKKVKATRFTSSLSYDDYAQIIQDLQPDYFEGFVLSTPIDAWYLSHPIKLNFRLQQFSANEIFTSLFRGNSTAMKHEEFLSHIMTAEMMFLIHGYVKRIMAEELDPEGIIVAYQAVVNYGDSLVRKMNNTVTPKYDYPKHRSDKLNMPSIDYWGRQKVMSLPAGCGFSGGFTFGSSLQNFLPQNALEQFFGNSVGLFGTESFDYVNDPNLCRCSGQEPHFHCPGKNGRCHHAIVVGKGITTCPQCGQGKTC